ncbi:Trehalose-6-P synthase/phosphatase complex synthase subunit [Binucleata daphniae]
MRLIIISNRLPLTIKKHNTTFEYKETSGGLVTGLKAVKETLPFLWIGNISGMKLNESERETIQKDCWEMFKSIPVFIDSELNERSYNGFCNGILWPLIHSFPDDVTFSHDDYDGYKEYNKLFCKKVCEIANDGDIVWVHDYHLMLLPMMLRKNCKKKIKIGFFLHTPFSGFDVFGLLPAAKQILTGIIGADHIAFHSYDYLANFIDSCHNILPTLSDIEESCDNATQSEIKADNKSQVTNDKDKNAQNHSDKNKSTQNDIIKYMSGNVIVGSRTISLMAVPIGIEPNLFYECLKKTETKNRAAELQKRFENKKIIVGVDRTDFIKGIPNRIKGFQRYLERSGDKNTVFLQVAVPSRTDVPEYASYINTMNLMVTELNSSIGKIDEVYLYILNNSVAFEELCAIYSVGHCCLISSVIDGMNLVALEYIACQEKNQGVLLLSEFAGCQSTLPGSVFFNPWNTESIADAIECGLNMSKEEKKDRFDINFANVNNFTAVKWAEDNVASLQKLND